MRKMNLATEVSYYLMLQILEITTEFPQVFIESYCRHFRPTPSQLPTGASEVTARYHLNLTKHASKLSLIGRPHTNDKIVRGLKR